MRHATSNLAETDCVVRYARAEDREAIVCLARLDSAREPAGPLLVAESAGGIIAALPIAGGDPIANPFVRTAELVELLRLRAAQLGSGRTPRRRGLRDHAIRLLRPATAS
jgi:hypothetical protein